MSRVIALASLILFLSIWIDGCSRQSVTDFSPYPGTVESTASEGASIIGENGPIQHSLISTCAAGAGEIR